MTPKFESKNCISSDSQADLPMQKKGNGKSTEAVDMLKRDRFELLSAYLDGEVTAAERRQVEDWLATDPEVQCLYRRLLNLRQALRTMPVPPLEQPTCTVEQVFNKLNHRPKRAVTWGGAAIAAMFIGALSSVLSGQQLPGSQMAQAPESTAQPATLMVALNSPVVEIPKVPASTPQRLVKPTQYIQQQSNQSVY